MKIIRLIKIVGLLILLPNVSMAEYLTLNEVTMKNNKEPTPIIIGSIKGCKATGLAQVDRMGIFEVSLIDGCNLNGVSLYFQGQEIHTSLEVNQHLIKVTNQALTKARMNDDKATLLRLEKIKESLSQENSAWTLQKGSFNRL